MSRRFRTSAALGGTVLTALAALTVLAAPASAHVTVHSYDATKGGYSLLDFRVPNEESTAFTTKVEITFATVIQSAAPQQIAGWSATVIPGKLAKRVTDDDGNVTTDGVAGIIYTATDKGIPPTYFQEFDVNTGPLPDQVTLAFPTLQTYSDGSIVRWIDPTVAGQGEPQHPAPILTLAAAAAPTAAARTPTVTATKVEKSTEGDTVGIVGVVLGVLGIGLAGYALRRRV
jgi:uncharacterized protein YcnI